MTSDILLDPKVWQELMFWAAIGVAVVFLWIVYD